MVSTRKEVCNMIDNMSDIDFTVLCDIINLRFGEKTEKRIANEKRFVSEIKEAENSVNAGNYVTLSEMHKILGV